MILASLPSSLGAAEPRKDILGTKVPSFEKQIWPIFKAYCFDCHGEGEKLKGNLDLRLRRFVARGGRSGPAIEPGRPEDSLLYQRIRDKEMPPSKKKLSEEQTDLIGRWIAAGARTARPEPMTLPPGAAFTEEERRFWAFQPIAQPPIPTPQLRKKECIRTPIDAFLLAKLEEKDLSFSPEADRRTLLRRACFDLTGLPPTPEEIDRFLSDTSPDAYERLLDRLLGSPHYGERWGRHWLDVVGYADSEGYLGDQVRPYAYRYRDYAIRSFNRDKPFDQFIQEQLAGDEMLRPPYRNLSLTDQEKLEATGFLRMAPDGTAVEGADQTMARNQVVADTIQIVSTALLGLTVACAQCHNHRYDPIRQTDYYRMRALFEPALDWKAWRSDAERQVSLWTDAEQQKADQIEVEAAKVRTQHQRNLEDLVAKIFEREIAKLSDKERSLARSAATTPMGKRTSEQKRFLTEHPSLTVSLDNLGEFAGPAIKELEKKRDEALAPILARKPKGNFVRALTEVPGHVPTTYVFSRGDPNQPRQAVQPGELAIIDPQDQAHVPAKDPSLPSSGRRLAYARWLTSGKHPLTARVLVNRVWMHHFGRGIVGTVGDFGILGDRPTHPVLLDWLAGEFMAGGWRLKRLHKLIMSSTSYRQVCRRTAALEAVDPDNRFLGRMSARRLEAETLRDAVLAVSGKLVDKHFGPPAPVRADEVGQVVVGEDVKDPCGRPLPTRPLNGEESRRSVYVQVRRSLPLGLLELFDGPIVEPNCAARSSSTVVTQSLFLMNNDFVLKQATSFAERLRREAGVDRRAQVTRAWLLAFASLPSGTEMNSALTFLSGQTRRFHDRFAQMPAKVIQDTFGAADPELQALASFCHALLSANEFLYVD